MEHPVAVWTENGDIFLDIQTHLKIRLLAEGNEVVRLDVILFGFCGRKCYVRRA